MTDLSSKYSCYSDIQLYVFSPHICSSLWSNSWVCVILLSVSTRMSLLNKFWFWAFKAFYIKLWLGTPKETNYLVSFMLPRLLVSEMEILSPESTKFILAKEFLVSFFNPALALVISVASLNENYCFVILFIYWWMYSMPWMHSSNSWSSLKTFSCRSKLVLFSLRQLWAIRTSLSSARSDVLSISCSYSSYSSCSTC